MNRRVKLLTAALITLAVVIFVIVLVGRRPPPPDRLGWSGAGGVSMSTPPGA